MTAVRLGLAVVRAGLERVPVQTKQEVGVLPGLTKEEGVVGGEASTSLQHRVGQVVQGAGQWLAGVGQAGTGLGSSIKSSLLQAVTPAKTTAAAKPGITYSEVVTGLDPGYAALGLLTTGALGTVLYSYTSGNSPASLAQGALDTIARNDIVQMASNAIGSAIGDTEDVVDDDYGNFNYDNVGYSDYYPDYYDYDYPDTFLGPKHDQINSNHYQTQTPGPDTSNGLPDNNVQFYEPKPMTHSEKSDDDQWRNVDRSSRPHFF